MPLFDPASSVAVVVTAPGSAQSSQEGLTNLGFNVIPTNVNRALL